jgi:hypothetical protein
VECHGNRDAAIRQSSSHDDMKPLTFNCVTTLCGQLCVSSDVDAATGRDHGAVDDKDRGGNGDFVGVGDDLLHFDGPPSS